MRLWRVTVYEDGQWHKYDLTRDGALVAEAKWRSNGIHAELHNLIHLSTPEVIKKVRENFKQIQNDCRAAGCRTITVCSAGRDEKMARYWELMGFKVFGAMMEI
jgi:hypothetical protein